MQALLVWEELVSQLKSNFVRSPSFKAECVIINAVECEPYLTADHQLMLEHAEEVMVGGGYSDEGGESQ